MHEQEAGDDSKEKPERAHYQVRLPGFIIEGDVGLGDVIKHATNAFGIKPCGGCEQRAAALNRLVKFTGRAR